jgi:hypothetical protein
MGARVDFDPLLRIHVAKHARAGTRGAACSDLCTPAAEADGSEAQRCSGSRLARPGAERSGSTHRPISRRHVGRAADAGADLEGLLETRVRRDESAPRWGTVAQLEALRSTGVQRTGSRTMGVWFDKLVDTSLEAFREATPPRDEDHRYRVWAAPCSRISCRSTAIHVASSSRFNSRTNNRSASQRCCAPMRRSDHVGVDLDHAGDFRWHGPTGMLL